jgi:hypothetical protein
MMHEELRNIAYALADIPRGSTLTIDELSKKLADFDIYAGPDSTFQEKIWARWKKSRDVKEHREILPTYLNLVAKFQGNETLTADYLKGTEYEHFGPHINSDALDWYCCGFVPKIHFDGRRITIVDYAARIRSFNSEIQALWLLFIGNALDEKSAISLDESSSGTLKYLIENQLVQEVEGARYFLTEAGGDEADSVTDKFYRELDKTLDHIIE